MAPNTPKAEVRRLLMATQLMEFVQEDGLIASEEIPFPVALGIAGDNLIVQVLTMQSTVKTWGDILEKDLKRILTNVQADAIHDQSLEFLQAFSVDVGLLVLGIDTCRGSVEVAIHSILTRGLQSMYI